MAMYFKIKRDNKWQVLYSHVNGDDLIKTCDTKKQADELLKVLKQKGV
jgi:hypothetical protein